MAIYIDSSALVKIAIDEADSRALRAFIGGEHDRWVSSALIRPEALRAVRRLGPESLTAVRETLRGLDLIAINDTILETAATLDPEILRTLDAIHLATALAIGDELRVLVTYDRRMAGGARLLGLLTVAPTE